MKAIVCTKYGLDNLKLEEVPKPIPVDGQVLVKIHAASVTTQNLVSITGKPFFVRLMIGALFRPKLKTPGDDIAGQIEAVGRNVKQFKPGDEVYGNLGRCGYSAYAEYVCAPENALAVKPANISYEEAATVPEAALVALQALRDKGQIKKGQKVLIYGASGGIGTFAVQIAKYYGAEVTGVCSTRNLEMVRSLGADHVIDYTKEDFTKSGQLYDLILTMRPFRSVFDYKRALSLQGIYVTTGGPRLVRIFQEMLLGPMVFRTGGKKLASGWMVQIDRNDLDFMKELIEAGKIKPVIDKRYPLSEAAEAFRYYATGHARGNVVFTIGQNNKS